MSLLSRYPISSAPSFSCSGALQSGFTRYYPGLLVSGESREVPPHASGLTENLPLAIASHSCEYNFLCDEEVEVDPDLGHLVLCDRRGRKIGKPQEFLLVNAATIELPRLSYVNDMASLIESKISVSVRAQKRLVLTRWNDYNESMGLPHGETVLSDDVIVWALREIFPAIASLELKMLILVLNRTRLDSVFGPGSLLAHHCDELICQVNRRLGSWYLQMGLEEPAEPEPLELSGILQEIHKDLMKTEFSYRELLFAEQKLCENAEVKPGILEMVLPEPLSGARITSRQTPFGVFFHVDLVDKDITVVAKDRLAFPEPYQELEKALKEKAFLQQSHGDCYSVPPRRNEPLVVCLPTVKYEVNDHLMHYHHSRPVTITLFGQAPNKKQSPLFQAMNKLLKEFEERVQAGYNEPPEILRMAQKVFALTDSAVPAWVYDHIKEITLLYENEDPLLVLTSVGRKLLCRTMAITFMWIAHNSRTVTFGRKSKQQKCWLSCYLGRDVKIEKDPVNPGSWVVCLNGKTKTRAGFSLSAIVGH